MINFKNELFSYAYKKRIPLIATIEIISECNFRCVHCYIDGNCRKDMLTYDQIIDFGNQIIEMGCLYVILTGGEVLLHPDFKRIYSFFVKRGVSVSVFTNGSLINEDIIELFKRFPPRVVEITMYGFSVNTYECVVKTKKFEAVKNNVIALKNNNINVMLKMFVLRENYCDFDKIRYFAISNSIPFKYDTKVIGSLDSKEVNHQVSETIALELELSDVSTVLQYDETTFNYVTGLKSNNLFQCGAGRSSCWLKSNNKLRACNFLSYLEFDLNVYKVAQAWELFSNNINKELPSYSKCYNCVYRKHCSYCPAIAYITKGCDNMSRHNIAYCKRAVARALSEKKDGE